MLGKYIDAWWFVGAFFVGILCVYLIRPAPVIVTKFPNPDNAGKTVYRDKSDQCYAYMATAQPCPADGTGVKPQPIEEFRGGACAAAGCSLNM